MRTLTLGVLIVSGGILAALPFRRYQSIPDASTGPVQATGPTQSAINDTSLKMQVDSQSDASVAETSLVELPDWSPPDVTQRRSVSIPLTYEDLLVPIDRPGEVHERYSATVAARQNQDPTGRMPALVMPDVESLALSQQDELQSRVAVVEVDGDTPQAGAHENRRNAKLASASWRSAAAEASPPSGTTAQRERHWIRQPD